MKDEYYELTILWYWADKVWDPWYQPVDRDPLVVAEGEVHLLAGEVLLHEGSDGVDDERLVLSALLPHVVRREVARHVHPVKLDRQVR